MMHEKAAWKPGISEIAKAFMVIAPGPHKGGLHHAIWNPNCKGQCGPMAIKLNLSWKTEVSKSAWIKSCYLSSAHVENKSEQSSHLNSLFSIPSQIFVISRFSNISLYIARFYVTFNLFSKSFIWKYLCCHFWSLLSKNIYFVS